MLLEQQPKALPDLVLDARIVADNFFISNGNKEKTRNLAGRIFGKEMRTQCITRPAPTG